MSIAEPTEIVLKSGVLAFDGRVIEAFGFLEERPYRIHVQQITRVQFDGRKLRVRGIPSPRVEMLVVLEREDEPSAPAVALLLDAVRAAAPNLEDR